MSKKLYCYDPGSAPGSPASMPYDEADRNLVKDARYLETMLRADAIEKPVRWPSITDTEAKTKKRSAGWRIILLVLMLLGGGAPAFADDSALVAAIRQVESGGDDLAVGDGGRARGAYQIHARAWKDACEFGGVKWSYDLAFSEPHARQAMRWYWSRYKAYTNEERARLWNGGPGWRKKLKATDDYWRKVEFRLKSGHATDKLGD